MSDYNERFGGIARLYGVAGLLRLRAAHVAVVGIGGVGSWVVEALARSGVGKLTLIDLDEVCVTNVNRQVPAITRNIGRAKVEAMRDRVLEINPECEVSAIQEFFTADNAQSFLSTPFDVVVDAIDSVSMKCQLVASAHHRKLQVVTMGGAGGRRDPTQIRVADLAQTSKDPLLADVRKKLRQAHGFSREARTFGVRCVYSAEPMIYPRSDGSVCGTPEPGERLRMDCRAGYGSASFVTGAFGFAAASETVRLIVEH